MTEFTGDGRRAITLRRHLARQLKALRLDAHKTVGDAVTARIGSKSKIERIESANVGVKMATVIHMCQVYRADEATTAKLLQTVEDIETVGEVWWEGYSELAEWFQTFLELEMIADRLFIHEPRVAPGLLQAPGYQQALFAIEGTESPQKQFEMRSRRQRAVLDRQCPLDVVAIIDEAALSRLIGSQETMAEQKAHLLDLSQRENIEIRILPYSAGAHPALLGAFNILEFNDPQEPDVAYVESYLGATYASQGKVVANFRTRFNAVYGLSVPIEEHLR